MANESGILVIGEVTPEGNLRSITGELLGAARALAAELKEEISVGLIGQGVAGKAQQAIALGAAKAYAVDGAGFQHYLNETFVPAAAAIVRRANPRIVLIGQTPNGRDLGAGLAFRLGTGIATDSLQLSIDPQTKGLRAGRSLNGGLFRQVLSIKTLPQIATVHMKAFDAPAADASRKGEVITVDSGVDASQARARFVKHTAVKQEGVRLEDARVVVTGGRGVGSAEGFKDLEKLAGMLIGAVGATRAAADSGYCGQDIMIGITGKVVAPELYLAVALSGASQHMAGCAGSKNIVAINRDAEANIFKESRFGVVGDYKQVLPAFTEEIKKLLGT